MSNIRVLHIEVDNCVECPYFRFNPGSKNSIFPYPLECIKAGKWIDRSTSPNLGSNSSHSPPDWCPLEKKEA